MLVNGVKLAQLKGDQTDEEQVYNGADHSNN